MTTAFQLGTSNSELGNIVVGSGASVNPDASLPSPGNSLGAPNSELENIILSAGATMNSVPTIGASTRRLGTINSELGNIVLGQNTAPPTFTYSLTGNLGTANSVLG